MKQYLHFSSPDQIRALEMAARRERAEALARSVGKAAHSLNTLLARAAAALTDKVRRRQSLKRHARVHRQTRSVPRGQA